MPSSLTNNAREKESEKERKNREKINERNFELHLILMKG